MSNSFDSTPDPKRSRSDAEQRLLEMAWKENLGSLTTGLIHDFCNLMTGVVSLSETLEAEAKGNEAVRNGLNLIRKTALDAGQLAHRVRRLYQEQPGEKNYLDLNEVVSNVTGLLQKLLSRRITFQLSLATGQLPLYADAVELQQVFVGLVLSATRAVKEAGTITIRTSVHKSASGDFPQPPKELSSSPIVRLSVGAPGKEIFAHDSNSAVDSFLAADSNLAIVHARKFAEKHEAALSFDSGASSSTIHLWFPQADLDEPQEHSQ
jgi:signal transduction histidine kinase